MSESKWKEMVARTTILRCLVGSQAYGLNLSENSDRDERAICVEEFEAANSLTGIFDEYVYRTAIERTGDKDAPSQAGDLDLTVYSLRKYLGLAVAGNPNMIELLFIKGDHTIAWEREGTELQDLYPSIISKNIVGRYLGYIKGQKARYLGTREGGRTELIEKYGYDVKCASHVLRLGFQAIELLTEGKLTLPLTGEAKAMCLSVKQGKHSIEEVHEASAAIEAKIRGLELTSELRDSPDIAKIEKWMQGVYRDRWNLNRKLLTVPESNYVH